jgi:Fe-S oxidoreductase
VASKNLDKIMGVLTQINIDKGLAILKNAKDSKLITNVNSCVHCGLCGESCIYYLTFKDSRNIPAQKVDLISSVYKRYCTFVGKHIPFLVNAKELDEGNVKEMVDLFFGSCTMCGRCNLHCSIGVDTPYLVRTGRMMLSEMGYTPASIQSTVDASINSGNNMGITNDEFVDTLKWLEDDLKDELGDEKAKIPINEKDKNIIYIKSSGT